MRPALLLDPRTSPVGRPQRWPELDDVEVVDVYELGEVDLSRFGALLIAGMVDQEFLLGQREVVAAFLGRGGVVVFCGQLFRPWLPGCGLFVPAVISGFGDYVVHLAEPHPVFAGVDPAALTFRRGVAGFFARGHHPPPPGATILATLAGGQPITWVDHHTTPGTIFVHAGADLFGYGSDDSTAAQLLDWACAEGRRS